MLRGLYHLGCVCAVVIMLFGVLTKHVQAQDQVKPRILLIFDTSGSMVWNIGPGGSMDRSYGDGSWDPWTDGRYCCPGKGNSKIYHAKEAVRQMVFATGDIEFALMKFVQEYIDGPGGTESGPDYLYYGNQEAGVMDTLTYQAHSSCEWPPNSDNPHTFAPYGDPEDIKWLCAEFPSSGMDSRGAVMMWMDHHQYSATDLGEVDDAPVASWSRAGDGLEQELRAIGATPIAGSLYAAKDYLSSVYAADYSADSDAAVCRPYSVILLTDGDETCKGDPEAAAIDLHTIDHSVEDKTVNIWVIGFAFNGETLDEIAEAGGTGYARTATNVSELSGVLYEIVSDSLLVEICNDRDDDCDGEVDEGFEKYCNNWEGSNTECGPDGSQISGETLCERPSECACDGIDNNCDGVTDELPDDATFWPMYPGACGGCDKNVTGQEYCVNVDEGRCKPGNLVCSPGVGYECQGSVDPSPETCNNLDDDCDGQIDEEISGGVCGSCSDGTWLCVNGETLCCGAGSTQTDCVPVKAATAEVCNLEDDDCDGLTDEDVVGSCGGCDDETCIDPNEGVCAAGQRICTMGVWSDCNGEIGPEDEICDSLDNDCDGLTDEEIVGDACGTCNDGHWHCIDGVEACCAGVDGDGRCLPVQIRSNEICDGIDNDCDGLTDEELAPQNCSAEGFEDRLGIGVCNAGYQICMNGEWGNVAPQNGEWQAELCLGRQEPIDEICDGLDNDCDGDTDEDLGGGTGCGPCGDGEEACIGGFLQCLGATAPSAEVCNGYDDNCNGLTDEGITKPCGGCAMPEEADGGVPEAFEDCIAAQEADTDIGPGEGECQEGAMFCDPGDTDLFGECQGGIGPTFERCDGKDNDCDGQVDESDEIEHVGEQCATAVGICEAGWWRCVPDGDGGKALECCESITEEGLCVPPVGPTQEICDGLDNDCNGEIDDALPEAGRPCGQGEGVCSAGTIACVCDTPGDPDSCSMICSGVSEGTDEICNALDDDCDGLTDEELPLGSVCTNAPGGVPVGECDSGNEACINGEWTCNANKPSDEICDGLDNDCDGTTDEELVVECQDNSVCIEGECAPICAGEELQCPSGLTCTPVIDNLGRDIRVCTTDVCRKGSENALPCVENRYWCDEGYEPICKCNQALRKCVSICDEILCADGTVCVPATGQCQPIGTDCYAKGCTEGEVCRSGECVDDPCPESCPDGQYCNFDGDCVEPCVDMTCPVRCHEGACVDPCDGVSCSNDEVCNDMTGKCEPPNACQGVQCAYYEVCEGGKCKEDPCFTIDCPNGLVCQNGSCGTWKTIAGQDTDPGELDTDSSSDHANDTDSSDRNGNGERVDRFGMDRVLATGAGGCMCRAAPGAPIHRGSWLMYAAMILIVGGWRLRSASMKRRLVAIGIVGTFMLIGCTTEPYVLDSVKGMRADGGNDSDTAEVETRSTSETDTEFKGSDECDSSSPDDDCDGVDDNCDGKTDEGVDLNTSARFCGACDNDCRERYANAFGICENGACKMGSCSPSYHDMNGDDADGCEYYCVFRSETDRCNGVDLGDGSYHGMDDDCDGVTDEAEDLNLKTDPANCGRCGNVCLGANVTVHCVDGTCSFDPETDCKSGFHDVNGKANDGCEYACTKTAEVDNLCDNKDNDCDGETDEGSPEGGAPCYELSSGCTVSETGEISCPKDSRCKPGVMVCRSGALVCEGQVGPAPIETCNGIDDNCNGEVDENLVESCSSGGADFKEVGVCRKGYRLCKDGAFDPDVCEGEELPGSEICDGLDNDCDGDTDEGDDGGALIGAACGQCGGREFCISGQKFCCLALDDEGKCIEPRAAEAETCNGFDDDCDGITDNNLTPVWCDGDDADLCKEGALVCVNGDFVCSDDSGDNAEVCDGIDNDCDGYTDTDDPKLLDPPEAFCNENCGDAYLGVTCTGASGWQCQYDCDRVECNALNQVVGNETLCDGLDNDCDGKTDENLITTAENCGGCGNNCYDVVGENVVNMVCIDAACRVSECTAGYHNLDGDLSCEYGPCTTTGDEGSVCDGVDNNCNGYTDEGIVVPEICDGIDNDCNGLTDDFDTTPDICNTQCDPTTYAISCDGADGWQCHYDCDNLDCIAEGTAISNADESKCDGVDNNCDGFTDEGFLLWTDQETTFGALCVSEGIGGCRQVGHVTCSADETAYVCCREPNGIGCDEANVIPKTPDSQIETGTPADGVDNDCDGTVDDGATGCVETVSIAGGDGRFEIFAYEASRRTAEQQAPCSEAQEENRSPWVNISFDAARDACLRLNDNEGDCSYDDPDGNSADCWDLCTAEQWYYACAYGVPTSSVPHLYPYGDSYAPSTCNGQDLQRGSAAPTGELTDCKASWNTDDVLMDMSGNVEEWTLDARDADGTELRVIRGGSYKAFASGLTCDFDFIAADEFDFQMDHLGFRCCKGSNPVSACQNSIDMLTGHPYTFDVPGDAARCEGDTWWVNADSDENWELGKTTLSAVGNSTCLFGTALNGNYTNNRDNELYSSPIDLTLCQGENISLTWNMYLANGGDTGDYLYLQQRTSTDGGDTFGDWTQLGGNFTDEVQMNATQSRTVSSNVTANTTYQFRFVFHADSSSANVGVYIDNLRLVVN